MLVVRWSVVLVVLAAVVGGLVVGVRAVAGALGGASAPAPTELTGDSSAEPSTGPAAPVECIAPGLTVQLTADAPTYALGQTATFTVTIANGGAAPCTVDAGRTAAQLVITSGSDRIWSSADCEPGDPRLLLLDTGGTDVSTIAWATDRSAPECPTGLPTIRAGTYQAVVTTSTATTAPLVFTIS